MKIKKQLISFVLISLFACNDSKKADNETQLPKVAFDYTVVPENFEAGPVTYVNDLEKIFTKKQNEELANLLERIQQDSGKKILILTVPSKEKSSKDWSITNGFTNSGILITVSVSIKNIGIGVAKDTKDVLSERTRESIIQNTMLPEFENGNYYFGINKGIEEIINHWH